MPRRCGLIGAVTGDIAIITVHGPFAVWTTSKKSPPTSASSGWPDGDDVDTGESSSTGEGSSPRSNRAFSIAAMAGVQVDVAISARLRSIRTAPPGAASPVHAVLDQ
jgi:hypothetical protein